MNFKVLISAVSICFSATAFEAQANDDTVIAEYLLDECYVLPELNPETIRVGDYGSPSIPYYAYYNYSYRKISTLLVLIYNRFGDQVFEREVRKLEPISVQIAGNRANSTTEAIDSANHKARIFLEEKQVFECVD